MHHAPPEDQAGRPISTKRQPPSRSREKPQTSTMCNNKDENVMAEPTGACTQPHGNDSVLMYKQGRKNLQWGRRGFVLIFKNHCRRTRITDISVFDERTVELVLPGPTVWLRMEFRVKSCSYSKCLSSISFPWSLFLPQLASQRNNPDVCYMHLSVISYL